MPSDLTVQEKHHPAKFSSSVLTELGYMLAEWAHGTTDDPTLVLDPWSGIGRIHRIAGLAYVTFAVELEPLWAENHGHAGRTVRGTARRLPFPDDTFDAVAGSPVYLNRMRDHHNARDTSKRNTYTHQYRELAGDRTVTLHPDNMGAMNDREYAAAAGEHLAELARVLKPGAPALINLSNSLDGDGENNCVEQWLNWLSLRRWHIREVRPVKTPRNGYGANGDRRVAHEVIAVAASPTGTPTLL